MDAPNAPIRSTREATGGVETAVAVALLVLCTLGLAIGSFAVARVKRADPAMVPGTVGAAMSEWGIDTPTMMKAGTYVYVITNTGSMEHEMLVMRTNLPASRLPMHDGDIDEDALPPMSDGENVPPGGTQRRTITLRPGRYLFVCNIPGHFAQGMYTWVTVI